MGKIKQLILLFITGFTQVFLVAFQTYMISNEKYIFIFFIGFTISLVWAYNIRKVNLGGFIQIFFYSLGAAIGSVLGTFISSNILKLWK